MERKLTSFFENFLKKESIFFDKKSLQTQFIPETLSHRDDQIKQIANILAPALKQDSPSNLFIYGKTGTGKTVTIKYITDQMAKVASKQDIPLKILYVNCKMKRIADTEYRLIAQLAREFGKAIPPTGLPTDEVYKIFYSAIDNTKNTIILILDEIDQLIKKTGDEILYNLTRINTELKNSQLSIIGVSNDLIFTDNLDPRIKSSLSEEEVVFPPYNAIQLQQILRDRAKLAFKDGVLEQGVIEKCAAYAAREHGDARRALELLRVSAEVAERENLDKVKIDHIDLAEEKIEKERVLDILAAQPKQTQLTLYAILLLNPQPNQAIFTGEVYELYKKLCYQTNLRPLTLRRVSDIIAEHEMFGILNTKTISKGRHGRTREISLAVPNYLKENIRKILEEALELEKQ